VRRTLLQERKCSKNDQDESRGSERRWNQYAGCQPRRHSKDFSVPDVRENARIDRCWYRRNALPVKTRPEIHGLTIELSARWTRAEMGEQSLQFFFGTLIVDHHADGELSFITVHRGLTIPTRGDALPTRDVL
jgi:hypothetical protein